MNKAGEGHRGGRKRGEEGGGEKREKGRAFGPGTSHLTIPEGGEAHTDACGDLVT